MKCNVCGSDLDIWDIQENFGISRRLGYGTKYDGERLQMRICCSCMEKLIDVCRISPVFDDESDKEE